MNGRIGISIYNFRTKRMLCIWVSIILGLVNGTLDELGEFEKMMAEPKDRSRYILNFSYVSYFELQVG